MKTDILSLEGKKLRSIDLPEQFDEEYRPDLIKRSVLALQSHKRQPYGSKPGAGNRHSSKISKQRRQYKTCYGAGVSRAPRKVMSRSGRHFAWVGAKAPFAVGGRRAHPPKAEKILALKINGKERLKALRSAIAATINKEIVQQRGHKSDAVPLVVENSFENVKKAKDVMLTLVKLGLENELNRSKEKKIRAGKGKLRGRKHIKKKGPLIVTSKNCELTKSAKNIAGVDVMEVRCLNTELLAPGTQPGRLTIWTEDAIKTMEKERLFTR